MGILPPRTTALFYGGAIGAGFFAARRALSDEPRPETGGGEAAIVVDGDDASSTDLESPEQG